MAMAGYVARDAPAGEIDLDATPFEHSSPLSLRQQPRTSTFSAAPLSPNIDESHDYNFSGAVYDNTASGTEPEQPQEDDYTPIDQRVFSGCSSISSFPA